MKNKLNDAVVLQGGQSDQLRSCGNNDPESWVLNEIHDWSADVRSLRSLLVAANGHFQISNPSFNIR